MADIFDTISPESKGDIFDQIKLNKGKSLRKGVFGDIPEEAYQRGERNWMGATERAGAGVRSALLGQGFQEGMINPTIAPMFSETFREQEEQKFVNEAGTKRKGLLRADRPLGYALNVIESPFKGAVGTTAGMATDFITDPVQTSLAVLTGGLSKELQAAKALSEAGKSVNKATKAGLAVDRFVNLPVQETLPGRVIGKSLKATADYAKSPLTEKIIAPFPKAVKKGVRSYRYSTQAEPKTIGEEVIYRPQSIADLQPKLEAQAKTKYGQAIKGTEKQLEVEKAALKKSLDDLSIKTKSDIDKWKGQFKTDAQRGSIEGKRRFGQLTRENSEAYDSKLDSISDQLEQSGKSITMDDLTSILDKTDSEIAEAYLGEGAPVKQIRLLREKFGLAPSEEANPEMALLSKQFPQMNFKNKGIDWSRAQIQGQGVSTNQPLKFKEVLKEIRKVSKAMSSKAKGAERAFSDEDIASAILKKNFGQWASENAPEFSKLQKEYSTLIDQMKAGRKIFKPGAKYDIATGSKFVEDIASGKADIREQELAKALQEGTPEYNRGLGQITQPAGKSLRKAEGIEKGAEIVKDKITGKSLKSQEALNKEIEQLQQALEARKAQLIARKGVGGTKKVNVEELLKRSGYLAKQRRVASGGGGANVLDYMLRTGLRRALFR
jgi:hypothetical protein